jgi:hypothetical protein
MAVVLSSRSGLSFQLLVYMIYGVMFTVYMHLQTCVAFMEASFLTPLHYE